MVVAWGLPLGVDCVCDGLWTVTISQNRRRVDAVFSPVGGRPMRYSVWGVFDEGCLGAAIEVRGGRVD